MLQRYLLVVATLATLIPFASAQDDPQKLSDFDYGTRGEDQITSVYAIDGQLYANFYQVFGDDAVGLISTLDQETAAATPVLAPDETAYFGGTLLRPDESVFRAGGMIFGIQRDLGTGVNLYRLDGAAPELLLSAADQDFFSRPTALGDELYFLTGQLPLRFNPFSNGQVLAEVWRTDGTAAGTEPASILLSLLGRGIPRIVGGTDRLFIAIPDGVQTYYTFEPASGDLTLVSRGFNQFTLDLPSPLTAIKTPLAFHNGGFYVYGRESGGPVTIYRIDEADGAVTEIPLPDIPNPFGLPTAYDQIEFQPLQDSLFVLAGRTEGMNGTDLYRIGGDDGLEVTTIRENSVGNFFLLEDYFFPYVQEDTLYYAARNETDSVTLFAYHPTMDAPAPLTNVLLNEGITYLTGAGSHLYAVSPDDNQIIRYNRATGEQITNGAEFNTLAAGFNSVINPVAVTPDAAYWVAAEQGTGLVKFPVTADTAQRFGNYAPTLGGNFPSIRGSSNASGELVLSTDRTITYQEAEDAFTTVDVPPLFGDNLSFSDRLRFDSTTYYLVRDTLFFPRLVDITGDTVRVLPIELDTPFDPTAPLIISVEQLSDSSAYVAFNDGVTNNTLDLRGRVVDGTFVLTPLLPEGFTQRPDRVTADFFTIDSSADETNTVMVYNYDGEELYRFTHPSSSNVVDTDADGAFAYSLDPTTFEPVFTFYGSDGSTTDMAVDTLLPAYLVRNYYRVGRRLLFMADTPEQGREWAVADPDAGTVTILLDINPGRGWSRWSRLADFVTDDGLFFDANDGTNGSELWFTDGTTEGTVMLADLNPGEGSSYPTSFVQWDSTIFFAANGSAGVEIYRVHARNRNPELIVDLYDGAGSSRASNFTVLNGSFYFLGREAAGETFELYRLAFDLVPTEASPTRLAAKVYPNPVQDGGLTVQAPEGETLLRTEVYNQQGQLLLNGGRATRLDLSNLPAGTYWLRSWYESGRFSINAVQRAR